MAAKTRNGAAAQLCKEETRAVHTHCYSHYLNFAEVDAKLMRSAFDTIHKTWYTIPNHRCTLSNTENQKLSRRMHSMPTRLSVLVNSLAYSILSRSVMLC